MCDADMPAFVIISPHGMSASGNSRPPAVAISSAFVCISSWPECSKHPCFSTHPDVHSSNVTRHLQFEPIFALPLAASCPDGFLWCWHTSVFRSPVLLVAFCPLSFCTMNPPPPVPTSVAHLRIL